MHENVDVGFIYISLRRGVPIVYPLYDEGQGLWRTKSFSRITVFEFILSCSTNVYGASDFGIHSTFAWGQRITEQHLIVVSNLSL